MNTNQAIYSIFRKKPVDIKLARIPDKNGITNRISSAKSGIYRYDVTFADGSTKTFIGKIKSDMVILNGMRMLSKNDIRILFMLIASHEIFGYCNGAAREAAVYNNIGAPIRQYMPEAIGACTNLFNTECFIAMEEFSAKNDFIKELHTSIDAISELHAMYFGDKTAVRKYMLNDYSATTYRKSRGHLKRIFNNLKNENTVIFGKEKIEIINSFIDSIDKEFMLVENRRTFTHNDYCNRNIHVSDDGICIYDWELACYQNPEHDIIELLISVMNELSDSDIKKAIEYYKTRIFEKTNIAVPDNEYNKILWFNTLEFCVNKLSIMRYAGKHLNLPYTDVLAKNTARMIDILQNDF